MTGTSRVQNELQPCESAAPHTGERVRFSCAARTREDASKGGVVRCELLATWRCVKRLYCFDLSKNVAVCGRTKCQDREVRTGVRRRRRRCNHLSARKWSANRNNDPRVGRPAHDGERMASQGSFMPTAQSALHAWTAGAPRPDLHRRCPPRRSARKDAIQYHASARRKTARARPVTTGGKTRQMPGRHSQPRRCDYRNVCTLRLAAQRRRHPCAPPAPVSCRQQSCCPF